MTVKSAREIAETLFGPVNWTDSKRGHCFCPGRSRHTGPDRQTDCTLFLDGVPSVYCFHTSCSGEIEAANRKFRQAVAGGQAPPARGGPDVYSPAPHCPRNHEAGAVARIKQRAHNSREYVLSAFATAPPDLFEQSPVRLTAGPKDDWRLLLQLFTPGDVVWIGGVKDSGAGHEQSFRPVSEWLALPRPPGPFTCPSTFRPGAWSRSKENVIATRFLVMESDSLTKPEICAVFSWLRQFLPLRAIVDTGGRSLHGWFDYPGPPVMAELKAILPALGCDPALFKPSQPCRLPGVPRGGAGMQALLYLDEAPVSGEQAPKIIP